MADDAAFDELPKFEPLKIKCSDSDCKSGRHAFKPNRRKKDWEKSYTGECRDCGENPVDWPRVRQRNLADVQGLFAELRHELIREEYFRAPFDEKAKAEARKLGPGGLKAKVRRFLAKKIGREKIWRDGVQTPKHGSAIFFAQHATATCCRKCLHYWYGVEEGRDLTPAELTFCEGLVNAYIDLRDAELFGNRPPADLGDLEATPDPEPDAS
jgi:hypothetical protein